MGMPDDFAAYLVSQGLASPYNRVGAWPVGIYVMPPDPDEFIVVSEYAGTPTEHLRTAVMAKPGLQIRVRGARFDPTGASAKITEIALALDGLGNCRINGTQYQAIISQQSGPFFLGLDDQANRPEFTWNFTVWRSH